jgi:hypothetical protein
MTQRRHSRAWRYAVLLVLWAAGPLAVQAADPLGRLFTTPKERAELDKIRYAKPAPSRPQTPVTTAGPSNEEPVSAIQGFRFDGIVTSSGGPSTAWVGGQRVLQKTWNEQGVLLDPERDPQGRLTVQLPGEGTEVQLSVGQTFDPAKQKVVDPMQRDATGGAK